MRSLSSRERIMATIAHREPDYTPLCFMIFTALRGMCKGPYKFVLKQLELGVDVVVDLGEYWRYSQIGWVERECRNRGMGMS